MAVDWKEIGSQAARIAPFLLFVILYFSLVRNDTSVALSTVLKCAPIICLMIFVLIKGTKFNREFKYTFLILGGLIFSCGGDLLLNIDLFPAGMGSFAVAHIFYISAFKLKPWRIWLCIPFYAAAIGMNVFLFPYLETVLKVGFPIYAFLLSSMCWRSSARATEQRTFLAFLCGFGSVLFLTSDALIAVTMFVTPIQYDRIYIMVTYYAAQCFIALSTLSDNR